MYEMEDIKYDFTNLNGGSFCQACLSSDRSLSLIGDYVDVFTLLSQNIMPQPLLLCWECMANLKRIKDFKDKIEEAQSILSYHYDNEQKLLLQSLSKLTKTYTDNIIFISYDEDEDDCKEKLEIKQENDEHSNDCFNNYEEDINFSRQEIKKESVEEKKVTKRSKPQKSKTLHYKIVYEKHAKKVLRKKFPIQLKDSKKWWGKEKNSDFFKKFKYKCEFCINGFNVKENLEKHVMKYHDESIGPHVCPTCHRRFTNESELTEHIQTHGFAWECLRCGLQFYTTKRINAHIKTHGVVQCIYCEAKFLDLRSFNSHYKSLHSLFLCNDCDKRCRSKQKIEKHVLNLHLKQYPCLHCERVYKSVTGLHLHCATQHNPSAAELCYCVLCDKQFRSQVSYRAHLRETEAHRSERGNKAKKKFPCPECSNTYTRKTFMMNHYRHVHLKQSRHYCSNCDKHFLTRTRYLDHVRSIHEGIQKEKNKLCNICGRGFAAARTLENHIRTHSGERPFECEYCSAKFTQRVSMLSHVKHIHMKCKRRACYIRSHYRDPGT